MATSRREFIRHLSLAGTFPFIGKETLLQSAESIFYAHEEYPKLIDAPEDPKQWPEFRRKLNEWRESKKKSLKYNSAPYDDPAYAWAAKNYSCCFLMMYDLHFFDPKTNTYTLTKIINRGKRDFGGYDSVVLWHAYPRIGIDERNQFDFYRDMPGGLTGLRKVVDEFHANNIKVFINYNPWDTSTRRENKSDVDALIDIIAAIDADGIFLDTLKEVESVYRGKLNTVKPGIVLEGESAADIENIPTNHASWAQWFSDKYVPGVLRNKWFERRHMQHQIARWDRDHTTELQQAWMNGSGMMVWENVFGQWLGWSERDKSILRAMLPIQRRYHSLFTDELWTPLVETLHDGVFASLWEGNGIKLWTIVNRLEETINGDILNIDSGNAYDLVKGKKIDTKIFNGIIAPRSVACIVAGTDASLGKDFKHFLSSVSKTNSRYSSDSTLPIHQTKIKKTSTVTVRKLPPEMIELKPHTCNQRVEMLLREVGDYKSAMDVNVSDQLNRPYLMLRTARIKKIAIDKYPVTNDDFAEFISVASYKPIVSHLFLHHWKNGRAPVGKEKHPVVYVSLDDARAYAQWKGKRLVAESEWQFAAAGYDQLRFPWGNELKQGLYNDTSGTTAVDAYPGGRSPFGVYDLCGNTWELTESEYADEHNRFCILKGGSYFHAKDSIWYTSGGPVHNSLSTKFLMMYSGLDRCSTVGFRCAVDL